MEITNQHLLHVYPRDTGRTAPMATISTCSPAAWPALVPGMWRGEEDKKADLNANMLGDELRTPLLSEDQIKTEPYDEHLEDAPLIQPRVIGEMHMMVKMEPCSPVHGSANEALPNSCEHPQHQHRHDPNDSMAVNLSHRSEPSPTPVKPRYKSVARHLAAAGLSPLMQRTALLAGLTPQHIEDVLFCEVCNTQFYDLRVLRDHTADHENSIKKQKAKLRKAEAQQRIYQKQMDRDEAKRLREQKKLKAVQKHRAKEDTDRGQELNGPLKRVGDNGSPSKSPEDGGGGFKCNHCDSSFITRRSLGMHARAHPKCKQCMVRFPTKQQLSKHTCPEKPGEDPSITDSSRKKQAKIMSWLMSTAKSHEGEPFVSVPVEEEDRAILDRSESASVKDSEKSSTASESEMNSENTDKRSVKKKLYIDEAKDEEASPEAESIEEQHLPLKQMKKPLLDTTVVETVVEENVQRAEALTSVTPPPTINPKEAIVKDSSDEKKEIMRVVNVAFGEKREDKLSHSVMESVSLDTVTALSDKSTEKKVKISRTQVVCHESNTKRMSSDQPEVSRREEIQTSVKESVSVNSDSTSSRSSKGPCTKLTPTKRKSLFTVLATLCVAKSPPQEIQPTLPEEKLLSSTDSDSTSTISTASVGNVKRRVVPSKDMTPTAVVKTLIAATEAIKENPQKPPASGNTPSFSDSDPGSATQSVKTKGIPSKSQLLPANNETDPAGDQLKEDACKKQSGTRSESVSVASNSANADRSVSAKPMKSKVLLSSEQKSLSTNKDAINTVGSLSVKHTKENISVLTDKSLTLDTHLASTIKSVFSKDIETKALSSKKKSLSASIAKANVPSDELKENTKEKLQGSIITDLLSADRNSTVLNKCLKRKTLPSKRKSLSANSEALNVDIDLSKKTTKENLAAKKLLPTVSDPAKTTSFASNKVVKKKAPLSKRKLQCDITASVNNLSEKNIKVSLKKSLSVDSDATSTASSMSNKGLKKKVLPSRKKSTAESDSDLFEREIKEELPVSIKKSLSSDSDTTSDIDSVGKKHIKKKIEHSTRKLAGSDTASSISSSCSAMSGKGSKEKPLLPVKKSSPAHSKAPGLVGSKKMTAVKVKKSRKTSISIDESTQGVDSSAKNKDAKVNQKKTNIKVCLEIKSEKKTGTKRKTPVTKATNGVECDAVSHVSNTSESAVDENEPIPKKKKKTSQKKSVRVLPEVEAADAGVGRGVIPKQMKALKAKDNIEKDFNTTSLISTTTSSSSSFEGIVGTLEKDSITNIDVKLPTKKSRGRPAIAKKVVSKEELTCQSCFIVFNNIGLLKNHIRGHKWKHPHICATCGLPMKSALDVKAHQKVHSAGKPFKCDNCDSAFSRRFFLELHLRTHSGEKPFSCDLCGKCFAQSSHLKMHMTTHTKEKPRKCEVCGVAFVMASKLKDHMRIHTGERPFQCHLCPKTFAQAYYLKIHLRTHSGEKPYKCTVCGQGFRQSCHVIIHMRTHTGENPYKCEDCGTAFRHSPLLKKHKKIGCSPKPKENQPKVAKEEGGDSNQMKKETAD